MSPAMRVVIATFQRADHAESFARRIRRRLKREVSAATIAAAGDSFHGHRLVVVRVPEDEVGVALDLATRTGGVIHEPSVRPERPGLIARLSSLIGATKRVR